MHDGDNDANLGQHDRRSVAVIVAFLAVAASAVVMGILLGKSIHRSNRAISDVKTLAHRADVLSRSNRAAIRGNKRALVQIQQSRLESCRRTYDIINGVLTASVKASKRQLTDDEKAQLRQFRKLLDRRKCVKVIQPPPIPKSQPKSQQR